MKIFFNSSMPRSGSTLLQNVLGQNKNIFVTPTSGVLELLYGAQANFSSSPEFKAQDFAVVSEGFKGFCRAGLEGYFKSITQCPYVVDKSRGWGAYYPFLNSFYPQPKIVCMVRDLRAIIASFEKKEREAGLLNRGVVDHSKLLNTTVYKRADNYLSTPPVGLSLNRLYDIIQSGNYKNIHFIKFEELCLHPKFEIEKLYDYLEIPLSDRIDHDFSNVEQLTYEDDEVYGIRNLHHIRRAIVPVPDYYRDVLGNSLCEQIVTANQWFFNHFNYE